MRELVGEMMALAASIPEYRDHAAQVKVLETTSAAYYGKGYQDVERRVPKIANTQTDLGWKPEVTMQQALARLFEHYKDQLDSARGLIN